MRALRTVLAGTAATALAVSGIVFSTSASAQQAAAAAAPVGAVGTYTTVTPKRILDTRTGLGAPKRIVGQGATVRLQVNGRGGVPATGVSAVVLNLTVTGTLSGGYLTAYPDGASRPTASSINFNTGWTRANSITVAVGASGFVNIFQSSRGAHVIADVVGYYSSDEAAPVGSTYVPFDPDRYDDTRAGGAPPVSGGGWIRYGVGFVDDEENEFARAVTAFAVNLTAVNPAGGGYLTAWNGSGGAPANVSTVNYGRGGVWPNSAIVPTAPCDFGACAGTGIPMFGVYTSGTTHFLVDLVGVYVNDTFEGLKFKPMTPQRILDTRPGAQLAGGRTIQVDPAAAITPETEALSLNVTAVKPTTGTYLTVWPDGVPRPTVSTLNPNRGETVANGATAGLGVAGEGLPPQFQIYNNSGAIDVVADLGGVFEWFPSTPPLARGADSAAPSMTARLVASERN